MKSNVFDAVKSAHRRFAFEIEVRGRELAALLNVSERRVQALAAEGIIPRSATRRGRFPLVASIHGYLAHLREAVSVCSGALSDKGASRRRFLAMFEQTDTLEPEEVEEILQHLHKGILKLRKHVKAQVKRRGGR